MGWDYCFRATWKMACVALSKPFPTRALRSYSTYSHVYDFSKTKNVKSSSSKEKINRIIAPRGPLKRSLKPIEFYGNQIKSHYLICNINKISTFARLKKYTWTTAIWVWVWVLRVFQLRRRSARFDGRVCFFSGVLPHPATSKNLKSKRRNMAKKFFWMRTDINNVSK